MRAIIHRTFTCLLIASFAISPGVLSAEGSHGVVLLQGLAPRVSLYREQALAGSGAAFTRRAYHAGVSALLFRLTIKIAPAKAAFLTAPISFAGGLIRAYFALHFTVRFVDSLRLARDLISGRKTLSETVNWKKVIPTARIGFETAALYFAGAAIINIVYSALGIGIHQTVPGKPVQYSWDMILRGILPLLILVDREETIHRRLIFGGLLKRLGPRSANVVQALIFTISHFGARLPGGFEAGFTDTSLSGALPLFWSGMLLGRAYLTGGYWAAFIVHFLHDFSEEALRTSSGIFEILFIVAMVVGLMMSVARYLNARRAAGAARQVRKQAGHSQPDSSRPPEPLDVLPDFATNILSIGPGLANEEIKIALGRPTLSFSAIEPNVNAIAGARSNVRQADIDEGRFQFELSDIQVALPKMADQSVDFVHARLSVHYLRPDVLQAVFHDLNRILRPGGKIFIVMKADSDHWAHHFSSREDPDHLGWISYEDPPGRQLIRHFLSPTSLKKYAVSAQFTVESLTPHTARLDEDQHDSSLLTLVAVKDVGNRDFGYPAGTVPKNAVDLSPQEHGEGFKALFVVLGDGLTSLLTRKIPHLLQHVVLFRSSSYERSFNRRNVLRMGRDTATDA